MKKQSKLLKSEMETRLDQLQSKNEKSKKIVDMGELAPFYQDPTPKSVTRNIPKISLKVDNKPNYIEANLGLTQHFLRYISWWYELLE